MDARLASRACVLVMTLLLAGCAAPAYYGQLARGQIALLQSREPIEAILADSTRDADLQRRLRRVQDARRFAVDALALPDNASYTLYADLGREYALWNVLATPEFSLNAVTACFPIAGCVAYRGHYREVEARKQAEQLRGQGHDVIVAGVPAYSTLGWFDDPVLNTMMHWQDRQLIGTVFHELAHQKLYVTDDSAFNESFASFVEQQGLREYLGEDANLADVSAEQRKAFTALILNFRDELDALYASDLPPEVMRRRKAAMFAELRSRYRSLREDAWGGADPYGPWLVQPLNNASLLPFGLYERWVPAFAELYQRSGEDWPEFYANAESLSRLPPEQRRAQLQALMESPALP